MLTAPAATIARDRKMFLFDQTGTGASFFSKDNPYIALMADPVSTVWPKPVADFITHDGPALGIKKIAILYATNEFTGTQANAFRKFVKDSGAPIDIVYDQGVPTETTNYTVIINNIAAHQSRCGDSFGLRAERHCVSCATCRTSAPISKCCSASMPVLRPSCWKRTSAPRASSTSSPMCRRRSWNITSISAMDMKSYRAAWEKAYPDGKVEFGFNAVAGYTTGLVMEKTLAVATSLDQLELRRANFSLSNELKTLDGTYALDEMGGQIGELTPLGQLELDDKNPEKVKFISIYPHETATGKPVYIRVHDAVAN